MQSIRAGLGAACLAAALASGVTGSASAQARGVELNGFAGFFAPTKTEGLEGTREALRRGSLAYGGRLTYWSGGLLGIEATGAFSPARVRVTANSGSQFARSTKVFMGSARLMLNLTQSSSRFGVAVGAGPAYIRTGNTVASPALSESTVGATAGLSLRLNLGQNVALRGDAEDYLYKANLGGTSKVTTHDLVLSGGLALHF